MNTNLMSRGEVLLVLVYDYTKHEGNDWANPLSGYFFPHLGERKSETLNQNVLFGGAGDVAALKSLERRGLIRKVDGAPVPYCYALTEDGLIKVTKLLES